MLPDTSLNTVERCSGHAGTWGVKKEFHDMSLKIGKPVFKKMGIHPKSKNEKPDVIASDCQLASHHIEEGIGKYEESKTKHPLTILADAYGL